MLWWNKDKKEEKRQQKLCLHSWTLADYHGYVDASNDYEHIYTLKCLKCNKTRDIDMYDYYKMQELGLIKERY